jgi:DNA-binding NarL/FixJ family response regulator
VTEQRTTRPGYLRLLTATADCELPDVVVLEHVAGNRATLGERSVRVLIADGQALVRAGCRALLEEGERITVVGEAASGEEAVALAVETRPDVALLDLGLPGLDDLETTARIISHPAFARVALMLMASRESDERVFTGLRAGAVGVIAKNAEPAELIRAVHVVARGDALLSADAVRRLLSELPPQWVHHSQFAEQLQELTDRERGVVALVAMGLTNGEIAKQLVISPATAKTHVSRAMVKLGARHRAQLVVLAYETGLVQPRTSNPHLSDRALAIA